MSEIKHTPTPWKVGYKNTVGVVSQADDQSFGMVVPFIDVYGGNPSANADHIVKCVNMHDELVDALKQAYAVCKAHGYLDGGIEEALEKAGAL